VSKKEEAMDKLNLKTKNFAEKNIDLISEIFPNVITEIKDKNGNIRRVIDFDILKQELMDEVVEGNKERYQLVWPGKKEAILAANTPIVKTLRPVKGDSFKWDETKNIYIEGDNLEALKLIQESYLNKIKIIYIDPPYNTGNDFIYKDNFNKGLDVYLRESGQADEEGNRLFQNTENNGRYHSDWLTMIYPRLKLARSLLRDDGVIFISIDDNEVHNLRKLCDEIFGERNFVAEICWHKKTQPSFLSKEIANVKEYILFYKKSGDIRTFGGLTDVDKHIEMINISNEISERVIRKENTLIANGKYTGILYKGVYGNGALKIELMEDLEVVEGKPVNDVVLKGRFKWTQVTMNKSFDNGDIFHIKNIKSLRPTVERAEKKANIKPIIDLLSKNISKDIPTNTDASKEIKGLFDGINIVDYPKPVNLIKYLIKSVTYNDKDAIIMDFFSGSATTAHAVMELNAEDGGNRRYIMIQLPEPVGEKSLAYKAGFRNIAEIGKERIRRAGRKIREQTGANIDYGFRVFRIDTSNMKDIFYTPDKLEQSFLDKLESNIKEDRTGMDLLIQVMLELGLDLSLPMVSKYIEEKEVYFIGGNKLAACFEENIGEKLIREIAKTKPLKAVFRDSSFKDCQDKINLEEIFKTLSPETDIKIL
jgi:adenine-specific DNA-methyltransferase